VEFNLFLTTSFLEFGTQVWEEVGSFDVGDFIIADDWLAEEVVGADADESVLGCGDGFSAVVDVVIVFFDDIAVHIHLHFVVIGIVKGVNFFSSFCLRMWIMRLDLFSIVIR